MLYNSDHVLHGDASPKISYFGIMPHLARCRMRHNGDASFDPAFCMNHLILKAAHMPAMRNDLLSNVMIYGIIICPTSRGNTQNSWKHVFANYCLPLCGPMEIAR